jgi:hypothetical protein
MRVKYVANILLRVYNGFTSAMESDALLASGRYCSLCSVRQGEALSANGRQPINTKICMVDYVGDMMKPYQNGVDRIQGGGGLHRCATYNKKFPVFFPFLFPLTNAQPKRLERF